MNDRIEHVSRLHRPPNGSLYVPELYDWQYLHNPTRTAFLYSHRESDIQTITYKELIPAIHQAARLVADIIGIDIYDDRANYPIIAILSAAGN
ncbi:hypothetical protein C0993_004912 [Termitomyces sp. T159_Od127]|nr:hypothetical protein C0993_004912 [Termitomyces sp. T159_Od127]